MNENIVGIIPISQMTGEDDEETQQLQKLHSEATEFLKSFSWVQKIENSYFGMGCADILGVFLFEIEATNDEIDKWLWVVVGDLPPAYIVTDTATTPRAAVECYVYEMKRWITAVLGKKDLTSVIPVNAQASIENVDMLEKRLSFLEREFLQNGQT